MTSIRELAKRVGIGTGVTALVAGGAYAGAEFGKSRTLSPDDIADAVARGVAKGNMAEVAGVSYQAAATGTPTETPRPVTTTPTVTGTPTATETPRSATAAGLSAAEIRAAVEAAVATRVAPWEIKVAELEKKVPTATPTELPTKEIAGGVRLAGVPDKADPSKEDTGANHPTIKFINTSGVGPNTYREPGGLIMEADGMDTTAKKNKYAKGGVNPGADVVYDSGGSIRLASSVNREVFRWGAEAHQNLPEGGYVELWGAQMKVEIPRDSNATDPNMKVFVVDLPNKGKGHIYALTVKGLVNDGQQDEDRNRTAKVSKYIPGHIIADMYQARDESNLAFLSEEGFLQRVATAHAGGTNCGAEGCSRLTAVQFNTGTGSYDVYEQTLTQAEAKAAQFDWKLAAKGWKRVASNWQQ